METYRWRHESQELGTKVKTDDGDVILLVRCGHTVSPALQTRRTLLVLSGHDLGSIVARDRDCSRTIGVRRSRLSGVAAPSPMQSPDVRRLPDESDRGCTMKGIAAAGAGSGPRPCLRRGLPLHRQRECGVTTGPRPVWRARPSAPMA